MRAHEFMSESKKLRKSAQKAIPGLTVNQALNNNNNPYIAYRFGVALAAAPHGEMDPEHELGSNFIMIDYTDVGAEIRKKAEKLIGHPSTQKANSTSTELDNINKASPVKPFKGYKK